MSDNKPKVFPTSEQINKANETGEKIANQLAEENNVTPTEYATDGEAAAAALMKKRTEEQLKLREEKLAEMAKKAEAIDKKRDEVMSDKSSYSTPYPTASQPPVVPPNEPPSNNTFGSDDEEERFKKEYINQLSQPQMNQPHDVIELPSQGKTYKGDKRKVKLAYLTTADENILTSPNLAESGDFLEILINRKLLEPDLRYKDLLPGDRNAIMIWLRATAYGEMYGFTMLDENDTAFETEIDLNELKAVNFNVDPDEDGTWSFTLPKTGAHIKFKMLTVGDIEAIESYLETKQNELVNEEPSLVLKNQIVAVNGNTNRSEINAFVDNLMLYDANKLREYISSIECGIDLTITVGTPGGGSITTFLPFTPQFFWPNFQL